MNNGIYPKDNVVRYGSILLQISRLLPDPTGDRALIIRVSNYDERFTPSFQVTLSEAAARDFIGRLLVATAPAEDSVGEK